MALIEEILVFKLDEMRYALHLSAAERVLRAVQITPLPKGPEIVLGIVNVRGTIVPVVNIRRRFNLVEREIEPADQLLIARAGERLVGLMVDEVLGLHRDPAHEAVPEGQVLPRLPYVEGILKLKDGLVLIHDLRTFLSLDEEKDLDNEVDLV